MRILAKLTAKLTRRPAWEAPAGVTRGSPRGQWEAPVTRVYGEEVGGIAAAEVVRFEDGTRWEGLDVPIEPGLTAQESVDRAIQSLIDQGEFELCLEQIA